MAQAVLSKESVNFINEMHKERDLLKRPEAKKLGVLDQKLLNVLVRRDMSSSEKVREYNNILVPFRAMLGDVINNGVFMHPTKQTKTEHFEKQQPTIADNSEVPQIEKEEEEEEVDEEEEEVDEEEEEEEEEEELNLVEMMNIFQQMMRMPLILLIQKALNMNWKLKHGMKFFKK